MSRSKGRQAGRFTFRRRSRLFRPGPSSPHTSDSGRRLSSPRTASVSTWRPAGRRAIRGPAPFRSSRPERGLPRISGAGTSRSTRWHEVSRPTAPSVPSSIRSTAGRISRGGASGSSTPARSWTIRPARSGPSPTPCGSVSASIEVSAPPSRGHAAGVPFGPSVATAFGGGSSRCSEKTTSRRRERSS